MRWAAVVTATPVAMMATGEVSKTGLVPHTLNFLAEGFKELALPAACGVLDV